MLRFEGPAFSIVRLFALTLAAALVVAGCGGSAPSPTTTPAPATPVGAPSATGSAVRRGTSADENLAFTGSVSGQMASALTQCAILKRRDPDGVSDVFQAIITGTVSGASHSLRIVLQKFSGAGTYQSTPDAVRATAIVDAGAPAVASVTVNADGKSGTIDASGSDQISGSWSCSAVVPIG